MRASRNGQSSVLCFDSKIRRPRPPAQSASRPRWSRPWSLWRAAAAPAPCATRHTWEEVSVPSRERAGDQHFESHDRIGVPLSSPPTTTHSACRAPSLNMASTRHPPRQHQRQAGPLRPLGHPRVAHALPQAPDPPRERFGRVELTGHAVGGGRRSVGRLVKSSQPAGCSQSDLQTSAHSTHHTHATSPNHPAPPAPPRRVHQQVDVVLRQVGGDALRRLGDVHLVGGLVGVDGLGVEAHAGVMGVIGGGWGGGGWLGVIGVVGWC